MQGEMSDLGDSGSDESGSDQKEEEMEPMADDMEFEMDDDEDGQEG